MTPLAPVPAVLAGLVLFLVPGLAFLALLAPRERDGLDADERLYLAVAVSVLVSAWLGLLLAEAGLFSVVHAAALEATGAALALVFGRRRARWPLIRIGRRAALPVAAVLGLSLLLQARPTEALFGGRDPGTYVAAMGLVARTGAIVHADPAVLAIPKEDWELFYRHPEKPDFSWSRFMGFPLERPETGRVFPEFFHLFPVFGAYLAQTMGVKGALATPPLFGILGTLAVFFAGRRLFGGTTALLGTLLLGLNVLQVWFARYPASESMSQFLLFVGFLAFAHWEEREAPGLGALAGAAFGLSLLVRIDSVLLFGPPFAAHLLFRNAGGTLRGKRVAPLLVAFGLVALHGAVHAAFWARKYVEAIVNRPYWHQPPAVWIAGAVIAGMAAWIFHREGPRFVGGLEARRAPLAWSVTVALVLTASYAYLMRPSLSRWSGADGYPRSDAAALFRELDVDGDDVLREAEWTAAVERLSAKTVAAMDDSGNGELTRAEWRSGPPARPWLASFRRLAAHDAEALLRFGWFVTPLGLVLGLSGLCRRLHRWEPRLLLPTLTLLAFSAFYFYKLRVWNDYYFAMRRMVPVILPLLMLFAADALVAWARRDPRARAAAIAAGAILAALYVREVAPLWRHVEWRHSVRFVADMARRFGREDVVIFEQPASIHLLSLPLWAHHGVAALELARFNPDPDRLQHLVEDWRQRFRNIYFVHTYRTDLCGLFLERQQTYGFSTEEWERTTDRRPERAEPRSLSFTVSRVVPPQELQVPSLDEIDVGGTDDVQVSGLFDKEGGGDRTYRWTGSCGSLYFPGLRGKSRIEITTSTGRRPGPDPEVRVSLSGREIGRFVAGQDWQTHTLSLPPGLPSGPLVLRLDVPAWRPANVLPGSSDVRDLGVMVDRVRGATPPTPGSAASR